MKKTFIFIFVTIHNASYLALCFNQ